MIIHKNALVMIYNSLLCCQKIIIHSVSTLVSFSIILWGLSGVLSLSLYGYEFNIYGYLFWVAIALGIINVWAVFRVGKPLKELLYSQQKYETDFRYGLSVVRNNKNSIYDNQSEKENMFYQGRTLIGLLIIFTSLLSVKQK